MEGGQRWLDDLQRPAAQAVDSDEESVDSRDGNLSDGASVYSTQTVNSADQEDIYGRPGRGDTGDAAPEAAIEGGESEVERGIPSAINAPSIAAAQNGGDDAEDETPKPPKGRSIAHYAIDAKKAVYVSLDIEVGGEYCGVVQLSAEIVRIDLVAGRGAGNDTAPNIRREPNKFNKYVNPGEGAPWTDACTNLHGLHAEHPSIVGADDIAVVWGQFREWLNANTFPDEVGILVAWNGATCDLKWLWKLTQAPRSSLDMPSRLKYFVDPYRAISSYASCKLNPKKSKLDSLELGVVWTHIKGGTNLNGAHDSLVDVIAQTDIIVHPDFVPFINRTQSVQTISDIFTTTQQNEWKKQMEPVREVSYRNHRWRS